MIAKKKTGFILYIPLNKLPGPTFSLFRLIFA